MRFTQSPEDEIRLVYVTTVPQTLSFVSDEVAFLQQRGFRIWAVSSPGARLDQFGTQHGIPVEAVYMPRQITPVQDLRALLQLYLVFRKVRPAILHAHTPKAGLLATTAAFFARVPIRIFQINGLPHVAWAGWKRRLMANTTRVACALATHVFSVSQSMRNIAERENLCRIGKAILIHNGSSHGVDAHGIFCPDQVSKAASSSLRRSWGADEDSFVIGFCGRLVREKGIEELAAAFQMLDEGPEKFYLVVAGEVEPHDPVTPGALEYLKTHPRAHVLGWTANLAEVYAGMNLLVLPTYREGYPNVILEAGAMGIPVVATQVPGCVDAVIDGETGTLIPPRDPAALAGAIRKYAADPELCKRHGRKGRERTVSDFNPIDICQALHSEYRRALETKLRTRETTPALLKRALDLSTALVLLVVTSPVMLCIALLIRLRVGRPVLFRQARSGQDGKTFLMYKFRTMTDGRDANNVLLPDAERLTAVGQFLRATSLDELPELWNVLRGDMSLVGPRPLLPQYLPRYTREQRRRHEVKPGVTGWAQVNGRNSLGWEQRFEHDVWYVDNWSFALDLKILWLTLAAVIRRTGISADGHASMPEFQGVCPPENTRPA